MSAVNMSWTINTEVEPEFDTVFVSFHDEEHGLGFRVAFPRTVETHVLDAAVTNFPRLFFDYVRGCAEELERGDG